MDDKKIIKLEQDAAANPKRNIHQRILGIMSELDYIQKGDAKVNGQYRFASHDQVTGAIHPLLVKYGVTVLPTVEEVHQEGNRTSVKLAVCFFNSDDPGDCFTCRFCGYGIDSGDKGPGKAISYAYKYAILKTFCLETGDDPDAQGNSVYQAEEHKDDSISVESILGLSLLSDLQNLEEFLSHSAEITGKSVEYIRAEAVKRPESFKKSFEAWCASY